MNICGKHPAFGNRIWALTIIALPLVSLGQGLLTPPGAPAPTMKLDQVEPHIAINATNTPPDGGAIRNITARGS